MQLGVRLRFQGRIVSTFGDAQIINTGCGSAQRWHLTRFTNLLPTVGMDASVRLHRAIVDAISRKHAADCESLMAPHVKAAQERLAQLSIRGATDETQQTA